MRGWLSGVLLGVGATAMLGVGFADAQAPRQATQDRAVSADLLALSHDGGDGRQQITLVDPKQRVMAVYHVERATGTLQLKSVRNVQWDMTIEDYNSGMPAPRDIRALKEQQK